MGKGRKRKAGQRYPSGKYKPQNLNLMSPAQWRRIKDHGSQLSMDPRLGTELGRLNLVQGELNAEQVAVGHRIAAIYGAYERLHGRRRSVVSPSYQMGYGRSPEGDCDEATAQRIDADWKRVQENIPPWGRAVLEQLCVEDRAISPAQFGTVRQMLDRLALHLNMSVSRKAKASDGGNEKIRSWRDTHKSLATIEPE